jgi:mRNA deadenylase 3'-5' endonuclease subunit Ccr4
MQQPLSIPFGLRSAYAYHPKGEPWATNVTPAWGGTIDYIYFSPAHVTPIQWLDPIKAEQIVPHQVSLFVRLRVFSSHFQLLLLSAHQIQGLPCALYPSDHVCMMVEFTWHPNA